MEFKGFLQTLKNDNYHLDLSEAQVDYLREKAISYLMKTFGDDCINPSMAKVCYTLKYDREHFLSKTFVHNQYSIDCLLSFIDPE